MLLSEAPYRQSWTWVGSFHGLGRVGSRIFPYLVGRVGSNSVGQCGSLKMTQNVMLSVSAKFPF